MLVLTVGDEDTAPLRLNPFEVPAGVRISTHAGNLLECFDAAFGLWDPLPFLYRTALTDVYRRKGLDVNATARGDEDRPVVVELAPLGDAQQQALVMALLLNAMTEHYKVHRDSSKLAHVTLVEEARRLLRRPGPGSGAGKESDATARAAARRTVAPPVTGVRLTYAPCCEFECWARWASRCAESRPSWGPRGSGPLSVCS
ncbi:hypothetical protein [Streptomyces sp. NPDC057690]|uniref:hypothetical protein n=1 Tax=Streptomyces sp. NPDC057690 TaxID=3346214 RepID=UPI0036C84E43